MKRTISLLLAFVAATAFAQGSATGAKAVSVRLVRFAGWSPEGAEKTFGFGSFGTRSKPSAFAASPTNACEAVFLVSAADNGRRVVGIDEDSFEIASAVSADGRDLLAATADGGDAFEYEPSGSDCFRVRFSPLAEPLFAAPEIHGRFSALVSPSNVTESVALAPRPGERAKLGPCSLRIRKAGANGMSFDDDDDSDKDAKPGLELEIRVKGSDLDEITVAAGDNEIFSKSLGPQSDSSGQLSIFGSASSVESGMMTEKNISSFRSASGKRISTTATTFTGKGTTTYAVSFEPPDADEITVTLVYPAAPESVPCEF